MSGIDNRYVAHYGALSETVGNPLNILATGRDAVVHLFAAKKSAFLFILLQHRGNKDTLFDAS